MKHQVEQLLLQSLEQLKKQGDIAHDLSPEIQVDRTRDAAHGDLACNIALMMAKSVGMNPRQMAEKIINCLPVSDNIEKVVIAGPGFINFFLTQASAGSIIKTVLEAGVQFGASSRGKNQRVHIEYVSANPTGPLHVGHGRGAAYGATVADILEFTGYKVHREYYVNDAGRQMHILAVSVWFRYLQAGGIPVKYPSQSYRGDYIRDIAQLLSTKVGDKLYKTEAEIFAGVCKDEDEENGDKEKHIDDLIANAKKLLKEDYQLVFQLAIDEILGDIKQDLAEFGVNYQRWFSEQSLMDRGLIDDAIRRLTEKGYMYEKGGALWFKSTEFGDDKDRVVVRENGQTTYFASDIAYSMDKLDRGHHLIINVLGADHHGYVPRLKAAMEALGANPDQLHVPLVQFAVLYRHGEKISMSTRAGEFVTLRQLREDVGNDAARFFYVMRKVEQHMDFDLDLAKSQSNDNPMYYIQYAHARICSIFRQLSEKGLDDNSAQGVDKIEYLTTRHEKELIKKISAFVETVNKASEELAPHHIVHYLRELANDFHSYYNADKVVIEDESIRQARVSLVAAVRQVLANGLTLLGVTAPEQM
ncbi:MAG TPA: arginine--tRNA ligase [Aeromonadales bacterium]|nr:arginine--tRNA ligase [Aeromonadales bacterium]